MKSFFNYRNMFFSHRIVSLILLHFAFFNFLFAMDGKGQKLHEIPISLNFEEDELIEVLHKIEEETHLNFDYRLKTIRKKEKFSSVDQKTSLRELLEKLARTYELKFTRYGVNILITEHLSNREGVRVEENLQPIPIRGRVTDNSGVPLPGASIIEKGTGNGTLSDFDGNFEISVNGPESIIVISYVGFETIEQRVGDVQEFSLSLKAQTSSLDEITLVGFTTKARKAVTGSITTLNGDEAAIAPVGNASTTLAGRVPGLVAVQSSGQPGFDEANLSIRGFGNPLVIVDGVEADFTTLDPNTIESYTVLKDAAASVYGARAGNGVILVTTKKGSLQKPLITINSAYTSQGVTTVSKPVNAGQYAELQREGHLNSGGSLDAVPYTLEEIELFYNGTDPQYPNTNWYEAIFRNSAPQFNHNVSVRGGSDAIRYYGFFGYLDQETIIQEGGSGYQRYNTVSNVDVKINKNFNFKMNLRNSIETKKYPRRGVSSGTSSAWEDFWNTQPIYPETLPDPTKISYAEGSNTGGAHITTNRDLSGYRDTGIENMNGIFQLEYKNNKGFEAEALFNYNKTNTNVKTFFKPVQFYTYSYETGLYTLEGSLGSKASLDLSHSEDRFMNGRATLKYGRSLGAHRIDALALYQVEDYHYSWLTAGRVDFITPEIEELYGGSTQGMTANGSSSLSSRKSWVSRLSYDFSKKYFLDFTFRADGSSQFPKDKRWGYFPGVSFAWRLSEENLFQNFNKLDELKLRLSYGEAGNDNVQGLLYQSGYQISNNNEDGISYLFGETSYKGINSLGLANPNLTWERITIYNAAMDFSFFNRSIYGQLDVFYRERDGIIGSRLNNFPSSVGASLPPENLNRMDNRGFELTLGSSGETGDFGWDVNGNLSWSRAKWTYFEEPDYEDPDLQRINQNTGQWTDRIFGLRSNGLFTSQEEIDNLTYNQDGGNNPNSSLRPGDIKYIDTNNDGIIDLKDQVDLGSIIPNWLVGFTLNLTYKSFDFSALMQGALSYNRIINFRPGSVYSETAYRERWTPANNNPNAIVPRIGGVNVRNSDFNIIDASYLRLKSMAFGYTLPTLENFNRIRVYVAGTNLLTFSKLNQYDLDPESPSGRGGLYYPQQKTISLGLTIEF